jgi:hypothetical protein
MPAVSSSNPGFGARSRTLPSQRSRNGCTCPTVSSVQTKPTGKLRALGYVGLERSTRRAVLVGPGPVPHRDRLRVRLPQSGFAALDRSLSVLGEAPTSFGRIAAVCAALNVEVNNREHRATKRKSSMIREVERQRLRPVPDTAQTIALGRASMVPANRPDGHL